jgi:hypothetical protein
LLKIHFTSRCRFTAARVARFAQIHPGPTVNPLGPNQPAYRTLIPNQKIDNQKKEENPNSVLIQMPAACSLCLDAGFKTNYLFRINQKIGHMSKEIDITAAGGPALFTLYKQVCAPQFF